MTDGLKPDTVSFSLGGQKYPVFFPDNSVIGVFNLNQCQTVAMQIGGQLDSASGRCSMQAGFQRILQQIREDQAKIDLVYRKTFRTTPAAARFSQKCSSRLGILETASER